jgi:hypothetical protein
VTGGMACKERQQRQIAWATDPNSLDAAWG